MKISFDFYFSCDIFKILRVNMINSRNIQKALLEKLNELNEEISQLKKLREESSKAMDVAYKNFHKLKS